jgi:hypothetical protein
LEDVLEVPCSQDSAARARKIILSYLIFTQLSVSLLEHDCKCDILYEVLLASQVLPKFFPRSGVQVGAPRDPIFCWADANSYRKYTL